jgi:hypothetical protein
MSNKSAATIATMGIDIGKNWFHVANGGNSPPDSCRPRPMAMTAELGQLRTLAVHTGCVESAQQSPRRI